MIEWNPVAQDRQARKAAQEAEEARREAEAEARGRCWHYRDDPPDMDPRRCENCRAGEEDDE